MCKDISRYVCTYMYVYMGIKICTDMQQGMSVYIYIYIHVYKRVYNKHIYVCIIYLCTWYKHQPYILYIVMYRSAYIQKYNNGMLQDTLID